MKRNLFKEGSSVRFVLALILTVGAWTANGSTYFAVENLQTGEVILRGTTTTQGIPRNKLILASTTPYRLWLYDPEKNTIGNVSFVTPTAGTRFSIPRVPLRRPVAPDSDGDGLDNRAEFVLGTDARNPDTDGDGVTDRAALLSGLDPAAGARTGIVGSANTPGTANDVCVMNDIAVIADSASGISVFNVFNRMAPLIIAQVDTPGSAQAVSCSGNLIAVADGPAGLAIIDISDPPAASILSQTLLGADAVAVTASGGLAYVGLANGQLVVAELNNGVVLQRLTIANTIHDVAIGGDVLYVLSSDHLYTLPLLQETLQVAGSVSAPGQTGGGWRRRLFVGEDVAYAVHVRGYTIFDLASTTQPAPVLDFISGQFYWKQVVMNGSGSALAAHGVSTGTENHFVHLYQVGDAGTNTQFVTTFPVPGIAVAVSLYNGLAYVADSVAGLHVINYYTTDVQGQPPTVTLSTSASLSGIESGKLLRLTAHVTDDVQVRNVEFYLDGVKIATDGNYPFEYRFNAPPWTSSKTSFKVQARASDTGGNAAWSETLTILLLPDQTPPHIVKVFPANGGWLGSVDSLVVYFNEPMNAALLNSGWFQLIDSGPDQYPRTGDDVVVAPAGFSSLPDINAIVINLASPLSPGLPLASAGPPLADLSGNVLPSVTSWGFHILSEPDGDHDGVPDSMEATLGLDPENSDSDLDGIEDGQEDFDNDGLSNVGEVAAGTNPTIPDSNDNGTPDGSEDPDLDGFTNAGEMLAGTNPLRWDTDGDGWNDETEVTAGTDPLDPASSPIPLVASTRASIQSITLPTDQNGMILGVYVGRPTVSVTTSGGTSEPFGVYVGQPTVSVTTAGGTSAPLEKGVWVGQPTVFIEPSEP